MKIHHDTAHELLFGSVVPEEFSSGKNPVNAGSQRLSLPMKIKCDEVPD
jgi:hypothetical protein